MKKTFLLLIIVFNLFFISTSLVQAVSLDLEFANFNNEIPENPPLSLKEAVNNIFYIAWVVILLIFIIIFVISVIEWVIYNKKLNKFKKHTSEVEIKNLNENDKKLQEQLYKKVKHAKNLFKTGIIMIIILIFLFIIAKYINANIACC